MPKALSERERTHIKNRLLREARDCLIRYGVKKTTVDELVRRVGIPKGTFYLFYKSKELLFFDVFNAMHEEYQSKIMADIAEIDGDINEKSLTEVLFRIYKLVDTSEISSLISGGEIELLLRKLPPEYSKLHEQQDDFRVEELVAMIPNIGTEKIKVYSAALRGIFVSILHKRDIGEEVFDDALRVMIRGVVIQMFEGNRDD